MIELHFSNDLLRFLRSSDSTGWVTFPVNGQDTVKHLIESKGIPHTEVGDIRVQDRSVSFDYRPVRGDRIICQGISPPFDVTKPSILRPDPLPAERFVVDVNVGRLALLLRILGIDTVYEPLNSDRRIAEIAESERRIVLSKDIGLLKRRQIDFGRYVRNTEPDLQLIEITNFYALLGPFSVFSRCLRCNEPLHPVSKEAVWHRLEPKTRLYYNSFKICATCDQIFWKGSHYDETLARLRRLGLLI
jgi:uncharacterized protein